MWEKRSHLMYSFRGRLMLNSQTVTQNASLPHTRNTDAASRVCHWARVSFSRHTQLLDATGHAPEVELIRCVSPARDGAWSGRNKKQGNDITLLHMHFETDIQTHEHGRDNRQALLSICPWVRVQIGNAPHMHMGGHVRANGFRTVKSVSLDFW